MCRQQQSELTRVYIYMCSMDNDAQWLASSWNHLDEEHGDLAVTRQIGMVEALEFMPALRMTRL